MPMIEETYQLNVGRKKFRVSLRSRILAVLVVGSGYGLARHPVT